MNEKISGLSAVIITCNAAHCLYRSLQSLTSLVDEIVIVDSGSTDDTLMIAESFNATIIHQSWQGFGPQKRIAVKAARHDWVLCLDADEWLSDELTAAIDRVMQNPRYKVYGMPRRNCFMGRFLKHGEAYPDVNVRLFHRQYATWSDDQVHEKILTDSPIGRLDGDLLHDSAESLDAYLQKQNRYTTLQAKKLAESGQEISISKAIVSAAFRFIKGYFFRRGFLDGFAGFVHIFIAASNSFFKYTKAINYQKEKNTQAIGFDENQQ